MLNPLVSGALALVLSATTALAAETPCTGLSAVRDALVDRGGGRIAHTERRRFARGAAAEARATPAASPTGHRALLVEVPPKTSATVRFVDGERVCAPLPPPPTWVAILRAIGAGAIAHVGTQD